MAHDEDGLTLEDSKIPDRPGERKDLQAQFRWDERGYLQLRRGVLGHPPLMQNAQLFQLFVVLLAQADFKDGKGVVHVNVREYTRRLGCGRNSLKRWLQQLCELGYLLPLGNRRYWLPKYDQRQ